MAALYEMTKEFAELYNSLEAICDIEFTPDGSGGYLDDDGNPVDPAAAREEMQQAWFDTLEGMEAGIQDKAEAIAVFIKNLGAETDALKAEETALKARRLSKEKKAEQLKQYLLDGLEAAKLSKVDAPRAYISVRVNPPSVSISDEAKFIAWAQENDDGLLRYKDPEIDKTAVKAAIKGGDKLPYVVLVQNRSLSIK